VDTDAFLAKALGIRDEFPGHHAILQHLLGVVEVVDEEVEGLEALFEAASTPRHSLRGSTRGMMSKGQARSIFSPSL
jgi:hypothetical protein